MKQYLIPTQPGMGRSLVNHDDRSRLYPARAMLPRGVDEIRRKTWGRYGVYDQGATPHCVAFAGKGVFNSATMRGRVPYRRRANFDTGEWYAGAQANDEWPGESYDGTSALGLCRYLAGRGALSEYRWCFGLHDVLLTLSYVGPVMLGVWWYESMFDPDGDGYIEPAGPQVGGHEVELVGVTPPTRNREGFVTLVNSWGRGWGVGGRAKLTWSDLEFLLAQDGDAVVLVK